MQYTNSKSYPDRFEPYDQIEVHFFDTLMLKLYSVTLAAFRKCAMPNNFKQMMLDLSGH